jgi:hypothetical protein
MPPGEDEPCRQGDSPKNHRALRAASAPPTRTHRCDGCGSPTGRLALVAEPRDALTELTPLPLPTGSPSATRALPTDHEGKEEHTKAQTKDRVDTSRASGEVAPREVCSHECRPCLAPRWWIGRAPPRVPKHRESTTRSFVLDFVPLPTGSPFATRALPTDHKGKERARRPRRRVVSTRRKRRARSRCAKCARTSADRASSVVDRACAAPSAEAPWNDHTILRLGLRALALTLVALSERATWIAVRDACSPMDHQGKGKHTKAQTKDRVGAIRRSLARSSAACGGQLWGGRSVAAEMATSDFVRHDELVRPSSIA